MADTRVPSAVAAVLLCGLTACSNGAGGLRDTDCGAARLAGFLGEPAVEVAAIETPGPVRILGPNDAMTLDFNPDRLTILTDSDGLVTELRCG